MLRAGIPSQRDSPAGRKAAGSPACPVGCLRAAPQSKLLFPRGRRGASISWRNALCRSVAIPCGSCCQEEFLPLTNLSIIVIIIKKSKKKKTKTPPFMAVCRRRLPQHHPKPTALLACAHGKGAGGPELACNSAHGSGRCCPLPTAVSVPGLPAKSQKFTQIWLVTRQGLQSLPLAPLCTGPNYIINAYLYP